MFLSFSLFFAGSDEVPGGADETARLHGRPAEFHLPAESGTSAGKPSVRWLSLSLSLNLFFTLKPLKCLEAIFLSSPGVVHFFLFLIPASKSNYTEGFYV